MSRQRFCRSFTCSRHRYFVCICLMAFALFIDKRPRESESRRNSTNVSGRNSTNVTNESAETTPMPKMQDDNCSLVEASFLRRDVDLRVIIVAYNRPHSVLRLLHSLNRAEYDGSTVVVEIWLDRSDDNNYSKETVQMAQKFVFDHGACDIHIHPHHVGIQGQWLDTWRSYDDFNEIAVILEDDLTVSPHFYTWLKLVHKTYGKRSDVSGFSLQGFQERHSDAQCCLRIPKKHKVFLYTTLGTSGFSPNNKHWMEFKRWSAEIKQKKHKIKVKIPGHVTWTWYRKMPSSIWEMEYLYYTWRHRQFTLYPNFQNQMGLTFNWFEDGLHFKANLKKISDERKGLVLTWKPEYEDLPTLPVYVNTRGKIRRPPKQK